MLSSSENIIIYLYIRIKLSLIPQVKFAIIPKRNLIPLAMLLKHNYYNWLINSIIRCQVMNQHTVWRAFKKLVEFAFSCMSSLWKFWEGTGWSEWSDWGRNGVKVEVGASDLLSLLSSFCFLIAPSLTREPVQRLWYCASRNSYTSLILSKFPTWNITWWSILISACQLIVTNWGPRKCPCPPHESRVKIINKTYDA